MDNVLDTHIELRTMKLNTILGVASTERVQTQEIEVSLRLYIDIKKSVQSSRLDDTIDYVRVLGDTRFILENSKFYLIESAAESIVNYLLSDHPIGFPKGVLKAVKIEIRKPAVLLYDASPTLHVYREKTQLPHLATVLKEGVSRETIFLSGECQIYRIVLQPGAYISIRKLASRDLALSNGLSIGDGVMSAGDVCGWTESDDRTYENRTDEPQALLWMTHEDLQTLDSHFELKEKFNRTPSEVEDFYLGVPKTYVTQPSILSTH